VSAGTAGAVGPPAIAAARRDRLRPSRTLRRVTALTVAAAAVYAAYGLIHFRRFRDGTFDLVIFDQAIRGYAHFHAPASMARGVADGIGTHFLVLGDHWSPMLALLAPLYWIHDGPATLIAAQAILFALAIPPLWAFTRRLLGPGAAYFVCAAYALSLPVASAVAFDFHEVAFVPVLTAVMAERFQAGRRLHAVIAAVALLLVKEDMGLLVAGYGGYLFLIKERRLGLSFMAGGVAATWLSTRVLIPAFGGSAGFYWAYGQLGSTAAGAAWHVAAHPLQTLRILVTPRVKLSTMLSLAAPLAFLPLASPLVVAAVPLLLERMLATGFPSWWTTDYHYDAFVVMIFLLAAVEGAARLQRLARVQVRATRPWLRIAPRAPRTGGGASAVPAPPGGGIAAKGAAPGWVALASVWAAAVCAAAIVALPASPLGQLLHPTFYTAGARIRAAASAASMVPDGALVEAADYVGPRLSGRAQVLLLDGTPRWAPWVVADTRGLDFPFCSPAQQAALVGYLKAHGYIQVFSRDGYVVLRRPEDARTQAALRHPAPSSGLRGNACARYRGGTG
jgi:uncharacterized membrane protein